MLIKVKFRFSELFFGMLLAGAIFALGAAFWSSRQSPSSEHPSQGEQKADDKNDTNNRKTQSLWVPVDSIGLYTLLLTAFTSILASASIFQGFMLLRADKTTRIAADAALLNAQALIDAERAHVYPVVKKSNLREVLRSASGCGDPSSCEGSDDIRPQIEVALKNLGRTPAIIHEMSMQIIQGSPNQQELPMPWISFLTPSSLAKQRPKRPFQ